MERMLKPGTVDELVQAIEWAVAGVHPLELIGGGSKRALGRPMQTETTLDLSGFSGITEYQPEELVMTAGAATPLAEIEAALDEKGQMLAFEPADYGALLGSAETAATLGGALACNLSGPRRIKAGAARDHLLGFQAVSGRAEAFKAGGKVVKNVTGYDLCKLLAGSWGTLAALHEVSIKVVPAPELIRTVLVFGLDAEAAIAVLGEAMASPHDVSGAAHLPAALAARSKVPYVAEAGAAVTALRVEGIGASVEARCAALRAMFAPRGDGEELHSMYSRPFWREIRDVAPFAGDARALWRISLPPSAGARTLAALSHSSLSEAYFDWAGGLLWLAVAAGEDAGAAPIRDAVTAIGGHATLLRATSDIRAAVPVFQPPAPGLAALSARLKESFDPTGVLNPGRMYSGV
ncbi:MAG: glycolate oxidase subunit GlcE [Alphaproteobacteria bacterium]|jgi:glycolate oxidase FAD binding subunit|nr:glycolate oxidase subunit GlcE [Alphaproteobacteria bacterium]MDP6588040.1 glycolate oxidase subunit GlcE [Alphaproteobacteria bacterium]MDP6819083.1 glycolate oxidase subunit GlcE [Alphaproteobacteria bacterium]